MTLEYRMKCLQYAIQLAKEDATVNMTENEILSEWGLQRTPHGPLHLAAARIDAQAAEIARLREALSKIATICADKTALHKHTSNIAIILTVAVLAEEALKEQP